MTRYHRLIERRQDARATGMAFGEWVLWCITIAGLLFVACPLVSYLVSH